MTAWLRFAVVELVMLAATLVGLLLLIPFCLARAWIPVGVIDRWAWGPLNWVYGNPEDGVSGQFAKIRTPEGQQVPYMPDAWPPWRAYRWSALRNSCDNLKYVFAWEAGPLIETKHLKMGWQRENGIKVPVFSV